MNDKEKLEVLVARDLNDPLLDLIAKARDQAIEAYRGTAFGNFLLAERAIFAGMSQWWFDYQMRDRLVP